MTIDEKKDMIQSRLSTVFVEKYDFFKETIDKLNELFVKYNVEFQYDYNTYCQEYIEKCISIIEKDPSIDLMNDKYFLVYGIISASMVNDKNKKYGKTNE